MTRLLTLVGCTRRATPWYTAPMAKHKKTGAPLPAPRDDRGPTYEEILCTISALLEAARDSAAKAVNSLMTATYWEIGRRIVVSEQAGKARAEYGEGLIARLAEDLAARHGRGFSARNCARCGPFTSAGRFGRHRLPNHWPGPRDSLRPLISPTRVGRVWLLRSSRSPRLRRWLRHFGCRGRTMYDFSRSTTPRPASSTKPSAARRMVHQTAQPPD